MKGLKLLTIYPGYCLQSLSKGFSTSSVKLQRHYKLLIVGAGAGGCAVANKFTSKLGAEEVGVIEPNEVHHYQPLWTLVGGGIKHVADCSQLTSKVLPRKCEWIREAAAGFNPDKCIVTLSSGEEIKYEYLVVATGLQLRFDKIKGLPAGFAKDPTLCSNYDYAYVQKTWPAIKNFKGGNAFFTIPNSSIKCIGAAQKIMYLAEETWRTKGLQDKTSVNMWTALKVIFGVKKYANTLHKIIKKRNIKVKYRMNLIEVKTDTREAVFENLESPTQETTTVKYDFLHITPPMTTPDAVKDSCLADSNGYVDIDKGTLQHVRYPNIFGLGDCTNAPTSKTAAAAATQSGILQRNLTALMLGKPLKAIYDGYTSCPLITARGKCILAEFNYDALPLETFPFDQGKERRSMYIVKKDILPIVYWRMMVNGLWNGPKFWRKIMHLGFDGPEKE